MGALLGLAWAAGLLLIAQAWLSGPSERAPRRSRLRESLAEAGLAQVTPARLIASCLGIGLVAGLAMAAVSRSPVVAAAFGLLAGYSPVALVGWRRRKRSDELRDLWPDVVDNLGSAVRAGLSLPEALAQLGTRGPEQLRAKAATPKPAAAKPKQDEGGPLLKMFQSSLSSIEHATTMVGESSLGSIAGFGIPDGATKSLIDTQAKAMHSVMGMTESVAKTASSFVGKGLSVLAKPFKR